MTHDAEWVSALRPLPYMTLTPRSKLPSSPRPAARTGVFVTHHSMKVALIPRTTQMAWAGPERAPEPFKGTQPWWNQYSAQHNALQVGMLSTWRHKHPEPQVAVKAFYAPKRFPCMPPIASPRLSLAERVSLSPTFA